MKRMYYHEPVEDTFYLALVSSEHYVSMKPNLQDQPANQNQFDKEDHEAFEAACKI